VFQLGATLEVWKPIWNKNGRLVPWTGEAYANLRDSMNSIPEGKMRDAALQRIKILDCGNPDKKLASCDPSAKPPREVLDWQKKLARSSADDEAYVLALASELRVVVCASDTNAIYIFGGIIKNYGQLAETGREAPALVDFIMSEKCPVSTSLTDDDKAKLLKIKQTAEKKFAPPSASKKE
jgi:hypothetical protein